jgi:hypothetical protein
MKKPGLRFAPSGLRRGIRHFHLLGEQPQRKLGMSPAKHVLSKVEGTQRPQRWEKNGENQLREYFSFPSQLGAFAPWREEFPNRRTFDFRDI